MNQNQATMVITPAKRSRVDFVTNQSAGASKATTREWPTEDLNPSAFARRLITDTTVSLPPQVQSIVEKKATSHLSLLVKHAEQAKLFSKMDIDKTFIPRSARIEFKLNGTKKAEATDEFICIKSETEDIVEKFKQDIAQMIKVSISIEMKITAAEIKESLVKNIGFLVSMAITKQNDTTTNVHAAVSFLTHSGYEALFKHSGLTLETFNSLYKKANKLDEYPPASNDALESWNPASACKSYICGLFVSPIEYHTQRSRDIATALALKQLCTESDTMDKSDAAMAEVDKEQAVGPEKLQELINKQVAEKTKDIMKELLRLKQKPNRPDAKNSKGRGTPSTSSKKQNGKEKEKPAARANTNGKAGAPNTGSGKKGKGKQPPKPPEKKNSSKPANGKGKNKSKGKPAAKRS
jgi:hypothetical protein